MKIALRFKVFVATGKRTMISHMRRERSSTNWIITAVPEICSHKNRKIGGKHNNEQKLAKIANVLCQ